VAFDVRLTRRQKNALVGKLPDLTLMGLEQLDHVNLTLRVPLDRHRRVPRLEDVGAAVVGEERLRRVKARRGRVGAPAGRSWIVGKELSRRIVPIVALSLVMMLS
jgi:hypothetical protein